MNIKPIKNKDDYDTAFKEISRLWGCKSNTKDGDKLDILCSLVDEYDRNNNPITYKSETLCTKCKIAINYIEKK